MGLLLAYSGLAPCQPALLRRDGMLLVFTGAVFENWVCFLVGLLGEGDGCPKVCFLVHPAPPFCSSDCLLLWGLQLAFSQTLTQWGIYILTSSFWCS